MVSLFDNHIGRKRNVDGGVLAGLSFRLGPKRYLAVTFSDPGRVAVFGDAGGFGTRQEKPEAVKHSGL